MGVSSRDADTGDYKRFMGMVTLGGVVEVLAGTFFGIIVGLYVRVRKALWASSCRITQGLSV